MKTIEKIILLVIIILLAAGIYVGLRNIDFFNVEEIEISVSGPVTYISADMQRMIRPLKGKNIFEVNIRNLKSSLSEFDGVKEVKVSRYYPGKLIIDICYNDIQLKAYSVSETNEVTYYFIHDNSLEVISAETWESFDQLGTVELNPAFAQMTLKWGSDEGFCAMVALAEHLTSNNLITSIKYDNNNGNAFGRLVVELSTLNVVLYVRELVSDQRLDEALAVIGNQFSASGAVVIYDLYANTLVKRT